MPTSKPHHTMRAVARETGLTPDVIRVWEKRYGAVSPQRTPSGQRLYSNADIERLQLLRRATLAGHGISRIANLSIERLRKLAVREQPSLPPSAGDAQKVFFARPHLEKCVVAIEHLDAEALENALARAVVHLGAVTLMDYVMEPLMERIDNLWESGGFRVAHEHLGSATLHVFLSNLARHAAPMLAAPVLVVTTPARQVHEIGALMAAATAVHEGWKVIYLGPNLPADEIALAAERSEATAVALSIVYPSDDLELPDELRKLQELLRLLPSPALLLVGGRAAAHYGGVLDAIGAVRIADMKGLRLKLATLLTEVGRERKNERT